MKMSKMNRKTVAIISLALVFVITVTAISFAWFQNYVDVKGTTVKTGRMLYNFYICAKDSEGNLTFITPEGADTEELTATYVSDSSKVQDSVSVTSEKIEIAPDKPSEFFFIIEKLDGSIDFDVSIAFDNDGFDPAVYDYVGSYQYGMYDDSNALCTENDIANYLSGAVVGEGQNAELTSFGNIWDDLQKGSVNTQKRFACIRMHLDMPQNTTPQAAGQTIPLRVNLCTAQTGALPGEEGRNQVRVETVDQLVDFMNDYKPGDEIIITKSINYTGDLLFTRPCTITVMQSTLTVYGNVLLSYIYDDAYKVNTSANGHIQVLKNNGVAGNFEVDVPNCSLELEGLNNIANGKADLYVEGNLTISASRDEGVRFNAFRVCDIESIGGLSYKDTLKPMTVNGATRIYTTHRTELGKITTTASCRKITIVNNGFIDGLDLREMKRDGTLLASAAIDFDNYGNLRDPLILLPSWAKKFDDTDTQSYQDNTRIIANVGSGFMQAVSDGQSVSDTSPSAYFFSNGSGGSDGIRDDIIYIRRTDFVELVTDGDLTKIIVHYEAPNEYTRPGGAPAEFASSLGSIIDFYSSVGKIADKTQIVDMTVICYGDKVLTEADYDYIRSMTAMTTMDLSGCVSEGRETPKGAFQNMKKLTHVDMPASDTVWNPYIFDGTSVEEIWFTAALQTLKNPVDAKGKVTSQQVLKGVKYVHTGINVPDGMYANINSSIYFFTPEEYVFEAYRNLVLVQSTGLPALGFARHIFMEAERHGDYFLRLFDDGTCEVATYDGDQFILGSEQASEFQFNFDTIYVNGTVYTIRSYDSYAFYNQLIDEVDLQIVFGAKLEYIGEYAFAANTFQTKGISRVEFLGKTLLDDHAFYDCNHLTSVVGENVTTFEGGYHFANAPLLTYVYLPRLSFVDGGASFDACSSLQEMHIGVIERTTENENFYTPSDTYFFTKFFVHTEFASAAALNYPKALAANDRILFVPSPYDTLYDDYNGLTSMGNHRLDELKLAKQNGDTASKSDEVAYYYCLNDDGQSATLVACVLSSINEGGNDHTTIAQFKDGSNVYTVTDIGSAAYLFTSFQGVDTLSVSDAVTGLGRYSFSACKTKFSKYCVTFDLNNVVRTGDHALEYVSMVKLVGTKLEEIGADAIHHNTEMRIAYLPVLTTAAVGTNAVFAENSELRYTYLGAPDSITYDSKNSLNKQYIRFYDTVNIQVTKDNSIPRTNVSTLVNTYCVTLFNNRTTLAAKSVEFGGANFSNVVFSDWYVLRGAVDSVDYTIELPGYVYLKDDTFEDGLKLFAVSPDLAVDSNTASYVTPNELYPTGNTHENLWGFGAGLTGYDVAPTAASSTAAYRVIRIGNYAYSTVKLSAQHIAVGSHVTVLEKNAFRFMTTTTTAAGVIQGASLDLANVVEAGEYAVNQAKVTSLTAPRLTTINQGTFAGCANVTSLHFPALVNVLNKEAFSGCSLLREITFGSGIKTFYQEMFTNCSKLETINILNATQVVTVNPSLTSKLNPPSTVKIRVPAAILNAYKTKYTSTFGGVALKNFEAFENAYTDANNTIFYWQEVSGSAYVTAIGGTLPTGTVTLPANVIKDGTSYTVIAVGPLAMQALTGATKIVLPTGMTALGFTAADVPATVTALEIAAGNTAFKTVDGILYDKDQTVILVYPKGHTATSFTLPSTVTSIASNAFYGAQRLETLTIPRSVKIADRAFASTVHLKTINFQSATASDFIGVDIFANVNDALKLYVPVGCLIDYKAHAWFDYTMQDRFVEGDWEGTIDPSLGGGAEVGEYAGMDFVTLSDGTYAVRASANAQDVTFVNIPQTYNGKAVTQILAEGFKDLPNLQQVTLPEGLLTINDNAFYGCYSLQNVTLPSTLTSIGRYAFYGCTAISEVTIPAAVNFIGEYAFYDTSLTSAVFENTTGWSIEDSSKAYEGTSYSSAVLKEYLKENLSFKSSWFYIEDEDYPSTLVFMYDSKVISSSDTEMNATALTQKMTIVLSESYGMSFYYHELYASYYKTNWIRSE